MAFLARPARTAFCETRSVISPPTFLLPFRARITTASTSHTLDSSNVPEPLIRSGQQIPADQQEKAQSPPKLAQNAAVPASPTSKPSSHTRTDKVITKVHPTIRDNLPLLHSQPSHYATIHIHGKPYLVTKGDTIRLPFLMPRVQAGDVLRLNRATHIGSRDYTLKAPAPLKGNADHGKKVYYLDERIFLCRATVMGVESEPLRVEEKTKRRRRHVKHVKSKMRFTVLRISDLEVKSLEEYSAAIGQ